MRPWPNSRQTSFLKSMYVQWLEKHYNGNGDILCSKYCKSIVYITKSPCNRHINHIISIPFIQSVFVSSMDPSKQLNGDKWNKKLLRKKILGKESANERGVGSAGHGDGGLTHYCTPFFTPQIIKYVFRSFLF